MHERPRMTIRQVAVNSCIVGAAVFLTLASIFYIGIGVTERDRIPTLETAGTEGVLAILASLCYCFAFLWDRGNRSMRSSQRARRWRRIFKRAFEGGLGAFIFSTGVLILAHPLPPALLAGLTIAVTWGLAIILMYLVWPEGLNIDKWMSW